MRPSDRRGRQCGWGCGDTTAHIQPTSLNARRGCEVLATIGESSRARARAACEARADVVGENDGGGCVCARTRVGRCEMREGGWHPPRMAFADDAPCTTRASITSTWPPHRPTRVAKVRLARLYVLCSPPLAARTNVPSAVLPYTTTWRLLLSSLCIISYWAVRCSQCVDAAMVVACRRRGLSRGWTCVSEGSWRCGRHHARPSAAAAAALERGTPTRGCARTVRCWAAVQPPQQAPQHMLQTPRMDTAALHG